MLLPKGYVFEKIIVCNEYFFLIGTDEILNQR